MADGKNGEYFEDENAPDYSEEEELGSHEISEMSYHDDPKLPSKRSVAKTFEAVNSDGTLKRFIRARKSDFVHNLIYLDGGKFSFAGRDYLRPIYDRNDSQILLKNARQTEKCVRVSTSFVNCGGTVKRVDAVVAGEEIAILDPDIPYYLRDEVVASESNGIKKCLRVETEYGFFIEGTLNHPLYTKDRGWVVLEELSVGDEIYCERDFSLLSYRKITRISDIGEHETWALQTGSGTFLANGILNHNTTFLANNLTVSAVVQPYNKALYVSPSHTQTRQFSNEKLRPAIEKSPLIHRYFQDSRVSSQVFEKGFTNGSYIFLRSAFRSADRTRGISARSLCIDEIQDFIGSEIPVIMECTSHFLDAKIMMSGTPKSFDNPIEDYWKSTTQNEWLVKCHACGKHNFLDERNVGPTEYYLSGKLPPGPICNKCQKPIYPHIHGRWISFKAAASIQGYRVPQLMVPWICGLDAQWVKLLWKRDNYPFGQFNNEVLGLSYDNASKPVTREEVIECCRDYLFWDPANLGRSINEAKRYQLTAGVDWGEGNDGSEKSPAGKVRSASYTVLTIGGYINQKVWRTFLVKRYMGKEIDPDYIVKDVARICNALGVVLCGVDWGHGWGVNNHLIRILGPKRVVQYQYLPKLKLRLKWDQLGFRYHIQRNFVMSEMFFDIKQKLVEFPKWSEFEPYAKDILSIYSEYVEYRREIRYDHKSSEPDDGFHSLLYAKLTSDIYTGKTRRYTFDIEGGIGSNSYSSF